MIAELQIGNGFAQKILVILVVIVLRLLFYFSLLYQMCWDIGDLGHGLLY